MEKSGSKRNLETMNIAPSRSFAIMESREIDT